MKKLVAVISCVLIALTARAASTQDLAAAECRKFIGQAGVSGGMKDKLQSRCEKRQIDLMTTGKPNLITSSVAEYVEYENQVSQEAALKRREDNPEAVERIKKKCAEVGLYVAYVSQMKDKGRSKNDSILEFKKLALDVKSQSLGESLVRAEILAAIRKLYDTNADWGVVASEGMQNCQTQYEQALSLR